MSREVPPDRNTSELRQQTMCLLYPLALKIAFRSSATRAERSSCHAQLWSHVAGWRRVVHGLMVAYQRVL